MPPPDYAAIMTSGTPSEDADTGRTFWYVLDDDDNPVPVAVDDLSEWARWHHENLHRRQVDFTEFCDPNVAVSTVFMGIDMSIGLGPPRFFETMVFGGEFDLFQQRYATIAQAREGHRGVVDMLRSGRSPVE
jgi:hypothetical protein